MLLQHSFLYFWLKIYPAIPEIKIVITVIPININLWFSKILNNYQIYPSSSDFDKLFLIGSLSFSFYFDL